MNTTIEVNDAAVMAAFNRMLVAGENPQRYLGAIGAALTNTTRLRFRESRAPDGATWAPLSAVTLALRRKKGAGAKPLLDTGRLQASIHHEVQGNSVVVGTDTKYGRMQQMGARMGEFGRYSQVDRVRKFGLGTFKGSAGTQKGFPIPWGNVPARPFLGVSTEDSGEIVDILTAHLVGP